MNSKRSQQLILTMLCAFFGITSAFAATEFTVDLRHHIFEPSLISIPENTKVKLIIVNHDDSPEEFDSFDLNREKVIPGNSNAVIFIGPLRPGIYPFFGVFYPKTAQGRIVVK